ncbi:hypothetical protein CIHG_06223 [Coccidioides immitis H538.4]|uniref:Uncharacterized protein n=1 Tax=Coccidioides immitis H538.4 TaxID=396776 RepID=A0A0J8ULJ2_COCIT|nr:hypothetical protein CIHG_06223 [Coccidioides immitis H538.4]
MIEASNSLAQKGSCVKRFCPSISAKAVGGKEATDIRDIMNMTPLAVPGRPELDFNQSQEMQNALANLVQKRPAALKAKVKCSTLSSKNKDSETSFRQSSSAWGGRLCYLWWPSGMLQNDVDVTETLLPGNADGACG